MKTNIIQIGNSVGVIIPKAIATRLKLHIRSAVNIIEHDGVVQIEPQPRAGWDELFKQYAQQEQQAGDFTHTLIPEAFEDEATQDDEWVW